MFDERAGDLVEREHLAARAALGEERLLELGAEPLRLLVETGVLHCDGELGAQRGQQARISRQHGPAPGRVDGEEADDVVVGAQRHGDHPLDAGLGHGAGDRRQAALVEGAWEDEHAAGSERAERELEQALRDDLVGAGEVTRRRRVETVAVAEVDGDPLDAEQFRDVRDRRVERVRERQLRNRLAEHVQQRPGPIQLDGERTGTLARAQALRRPHAEGCQPAQLALVRCGVVGEQQLEGAERRFAEPQRREQTLACG